MEPLAAIALLVVSLIIGVVMQHISVFPDNTHVVLNQYLIYIALPALAMIHVPTIQIDKALLFPVATAWIVFLFAVWIIRLLAGWMRWSRQTAGCLILTAGLGNTAFVGFPVVEALYGAQGLQVALMVDQPGTFVVTVTLGVITATLYSTGRSRKRDIFKQVVTFPPFIIFVFAIALNLLDIQVTGATLGVLEQFAATLTPIALISVGLQLKFASAGSQFHPLFLGLIYKLVLAPFVIFVLYALLFGAEGLTLDVSIIMAAMPPMITGSILATTYGLNPRLASLMVGIGVPASAVTITLWYFFMIWFG